MPARFGVEDVPLSWSDPREHLFKLASRINGLLRGKSNNVGEATLAASVTTTVVADRFVTPRSVILLSPLTATAAAAMPVTHVEAQAGKFTLNHDSDAATDRRFAYVVVG